ncbi:MAG: efflux RND transporter periplasmic adaptor subunit, partial [Candidatus Omnitrophica bacterium]|nr:efflux RND transporter periplasmic adaptor subunit [Candidatus Omnitrophota bacterium]
VFVVKPQEHSNEIIVVGTTGADEEANISAKIPGRVVSVNADAGMFVKKGQALITIDDSQLKIQKIQIQNQILMAQANLDAINIQMLDAQKDVKRMEELYKEGVISQKQLEGYQVKLETLQKNYESAQKNIQIIKDNLRLIDIQINDCVIEAPFDGIIGNKRVETGEVVGPGQILMTIYNIKKLNAQMRVPELYIPQIRPGQTVVISIDALEIGEIKGRVTKISGAPDPKTRMFTVYVSLPFANPLIKPGMFAKGRIIINRKNNALIVPEEAVFEEAGKNYIYIVENNQAKKAEVKTIQDLNGKIEIEYGISAGDKVVVSGKENLLPGSKVKIVKEVNAQ